jgi:hypothetical protein
VLVIDGEERNESAYACLPALKADGVIIWDNSDWTALYADGLKHSGGERIPEDRVSVGLPALLASLDDVHLLSARQQLLPDMNMVRIDSGQRVSPC